jgi:hypothetical protein
MDLVTVLSTINVMRWMDPLPRLAKGLQEDELLLYMNITTLGLLLFVHELFDEQ